MLSREIHLVQRPEGELKAGDFTLVERELAEPADGQILVQNLYMSVDPALRPRMSRGQELNEAIMGAALGRVVKSRSATFTEGDVVRSRNDVPLANERSLQEISHVGMIVDNENAHRRRKLPSTSRVHREADRRRSQRSVRAAEVAMQSAANMHCGLGSVW